MEIPKRRFRTVLGIPKGVLMKEKVISSNFPTAYGISCFNSKLQDAGLVTMSLT